MASRRNDLKPKDTYSTVKYVQVEGLALMKIAKHCHEECASDVIVAQGALLGLVVDDCLEITNCFAFPKSVDESINDEKYQLDMMKSLRQVNVDHYHVGWYQSSDVGNFLSLPLLESQFHYQTSIEESVVLIFDAPKTNRGFLSLSAYRLTPQALTMFKENDFLPETLKALKVGYDHLLVKVPVVIKNSTLTNILLSELNFKIKVDEGSEHLDIGTATVLEGQLRNLMDRVDDLNQEAIKFNRYQQAVVRQATDKYRYLQKRALENQARAAKDEPPLPEEDITKIFRALPVPPRLPPMLMATQVDSYSAEIAKFSTQSLAKLYMTKAMNTNN